MDWRRSYLLPDGTTANAKRAIQLPADERNGHHKRAKWLLGAGVLSMLTIVALPVGLPLILWGMHEANKAERIRSADDE